jgi:alpha-mannosidase
MKRLLLVLCGLFLSFSLLADDNFQKQPDKPVDLAKDKNLYVVGYAHLDTQWRWTYDYVIQNFIRNTMEQNFPLIEKYPNYVFNFTGSRRYEFMKEYYPAEYAKVKQYVAQGRWFPAGSSVDECDANIPSLESFTRHFLYGNRFFQHEFGMQSDEFMLPDCFGFPASLPEILAHGGIKGFSTQKLTWGSAVGIPFNVGTWIGPDGSSVYAALNPGAYTGSVNEDLSQSEMWLKRINETGGKSGAYVDYHYYGTGDRGGAPGEDSVKWIERSLAGTGSVRVISSKADQMFKDLAANPDIKLPTYTGDLLLVNHSAGSLNSEAYMKRWNRQNEELANAAESAATTAWWLKAFPYPADALYAAWDLVLGSQMHDIMPGTSLPEAYEFSWNDEVLALNRFASVTEHSTAAVVANLDTTAKGLAVAVYNPLPIDRDDAVEADLPINGTAPTAVTAYDPQGRPVPTQILGTDGDKLKVLFIAKAPSVGYAVYDLRPGSAAAAQSPLSVSANALENARYKVTLNDGGDISSIFDKSLNRELLSAPIRLSIHTEIPAQYPAWNMDWEDRNKPPRGYVDGTPKISILESGPARVALRVQRTAENGVFTQDIRLAAGSGGDRLEVLQHMDWRSSQASLKADFPLAATNPNASFEDKVGVTQRNNDNPNRFEMPLQQWMDLTDADGSFGATVMSDSKYGSDKPDDHTLRLTLVYTPGCSRGGYRDQATQDQGRHEILYAIAGHKGSWIDGKTSWQAARLNQPLRAFFTPSHPGSMGKTFSLLSTNSDQVQITAIKKAEDTDEVVLRVKELTGQPAQDVAVRFAVPVTAAREIDAQERPIGDATVTNGELTFNMKGFGLRAFAVKLAPPPATMSPISNQAVTLAYDVDAISTNDNQKDGAMDDAGDTYPAELLPTRLTREGVDFTLGPTADGQMNALSASGQDINLPAGRFNRVHVLAAADGDTTATIKIGGAENPFNVPNWTGFIGQWDDRVWDKPIDELDYDPSEKTVGLVPGYIKRTPVAWFATHHNTPKGDAFYRYSYLYELSYDLPVGATTLTLPNNPKIRVFAITVTREPNATPAASPLYDTLADHQPGGAPLVPQDGQTFHEATSITLVAPLYHQPGDLHYTLDGTDPTASSPVYDAPFEADDTVKVAVRQISADGNLGPIVRGVITIQDSTPPQLTDILADKNGTDVSLTFNKKLDPSTAGNPKNYAVSPSFPVSTATLAADGQHVTLSFGAPLVAGTSYSMALSGLTDTSPSHNALVPVTVPFNAQNILYRVDTATLPDQGISAPLTGLPLKKTDNWTMNVLVKPDTAPEDRTIIGGFGDDSNNPTPGLGRYFAVFQDGIRLWASNQDVTTNSPIQVGAWQMLTATYDGHTIVVYKDGEVIGKRDVDLSDDTQGNVNIGKPDPWDHKRLFHGSVQAFTIRRGAMTADDVKTLYGQTKPAE